jgi:hypothetical protein
MLLYLELVRGTKALDFLFFPNIIGIFLGNLKSFLTAHLICYSAALSAGALPPRWGKTMLLSYTCGAGRLCLTRNGLAD